MFSVLTAYSPVVTVPPAPTIIASSFGPKIGYIYGLFGILKVNNDYFPI